MKRNLLRIIDANLNRSREGLRVCEEITRFILDDAKLTAALKRTRHKISRTIKEFPGASCALLQSRDSLADVGNSFLSDSKRKNYKDLFCANIQRVKESLRVLEEFSYIYNQSLAKNFAKLRFKIYEIEKRFVARL